ncbi:hypothetical protein PAAG_01609 [Paracoccidioides lutzii Pb01]|uniref:Uncharacterized protein n=1 Tax=Paracoccidioides lutzii (strain ATCC MYA-826 / Pb01) TaxID=502779 RepID=C1GSW4_PARBA|nr:hypothetical protein PAAG_01609 [Paracoccidioides lutzii Pb01]EEH39147.2 hypothetical protein PAAG_01609 [Paracoccidioides lutzii Pb01]
MFEIEDGKLSSMLESMSLSPLTPTMTGLTIKYDGHTVPFESTIEIKTRVSHRPLEIEEVAPQLWVSQTPKLRPEVEDVAIEIKRWEDRNQTDLRKLAALLDKMLREVKGCDTFSVALSYKSSGSIFVPFLFHIINLSAWQSYRAVAWPPLTTSIHIGGVQYNTEVSKIPYLASFVKFQAKAQPGITEFVHGPILLFSEALKGIERVIDSVSESKGDKSKARDAAFKLLYLMPFGEFDDEVKNSTKIFNTVLFLVPHSGTFKWSTRSIMRAAYEERFVLSAKQRTSLDKWEKGEAARRPAEEDSDMTTKEESDWWNRGTIWNCTKKQFDSVVHASVVCLKTVIFDGLAASCIETAPPRAMMPGETDLLFQLWLDNYYKKPCPSDSQDVAKPTPKSFYPNSRIWILRNLTTWEFVISYSVALKPEYVSGPFISGIGFGEMILSRICWSTSGFISMENKHHINTASGLGISSISFHLIDSTMGTVLGKTLVMK